MSKPARRDRRSPEAVAYRRMYKTALWQRLRKGQLQREPLCERCKAKGMVVAATVVHHMDAHKGDPALFYDPARLASSCAPCHDGPEQSTERLGYSREIGVDGWPVDERHPVHNV